MLINFTNHPQKNWGYEQLSAAAQYGKAIADIPFPAVKPEMSEGEIAKLADEKVKEIMAYEPDAVLCQGEFSLTFAVVNRLKELGVKCITACSERVVSENTDEAGNKIRVSSYRFIRFREYI